MSKKSKRKKSGSPAQATLDSFRPVGNSQSNSSISSGPKTINFDKASPFSSRYFEWIALALASAFAYWILTARLVGVTVSVLVDEYAYVLDTHYKGLAEAYYPNHLFQLVFGATKTCGVEFYSCARSLNAVFVIAGALVLYALAKHISGKKWLAALAGLAAIFGSYGTYTAYFMPEAIFNFLMILFYWALIRFGKSDNLLTWSGIGAILGIASLAKPHALFVVPALVIFIFLWTRATKNSYWLPAIMRLSAFGVAVIGTKFSLGYLIAGERALSLFGSYGTIVSAGASATETLTENAGVDVIGTAWGQSLMVTMILGIGLPVAIVGFLGSFKKDPEQFDANRVRSVIGISLLNMMAVSAIFEAWQNIPIWMHTRYYSYLIPLAVVVLVEAYSRSRTSPNALLKRIIIGVFLAVSSVALFTAAIPYGANWIDAPDFRTHIDNLVISSIAIVIAIALAIWWVGDNKKPMLAGLAVALVAAIFSGTYISGFLVRSFGQDSTADQLSRILRNYIPQQELDQTVLAGPDRTSIERALFGALTGGATITGIPEGGLALADLAPDRKWLVTLGEAQINDFGEPEILGSGYALYSLSDSNSLIPRSNQMASFTKACPGSENTWACGDSTALTLTVGFPARATVDIILEISELASKTPVEFVLGESVLSEQLTPGVMSLTIPFGNTALVKELSVRATAGGPLADLVDEKFIRIVSVNLPSR